MNTNETVELLNAIASLAIMEQTDLCSLGDHELELYETEMDCLRDLIDELS